MTRYTDDRPIAIWLLVCCVLIFAMVVLGGVTRLTQSGLSMVEWNPIMGVVPPFGEAAWNQTFANYQASPEYRIVNYDMTLDQFQRIFYVEYVHRMLGRVIGFAFLVPLLWFLFSRRLCARLITKLVVLFVLGGLQGLLGWYMVKSGLIDQPHVSPYRLTAHLALALLIYGFMLWLVLDLSADRLAWLRLRGAQASWHVKVLAIVTLCVLATMIASGGFVAGTKAGYAFNTFPKMHEQWIPTGLWSFEPGWLNLFENVATVQFIHRCGAIAVLLSVFSLWLVVLRARLFPSRTRYVAHSTVVILMLQVGVGIATLVYVVPLPLAVAHQAGAMLLLSSVIVVAHRALRLGNGTETGHA